ncbi:mitochondrial intermembrane space import and assembly protein 40-like [Homarus americanus]|uniref:Mitochondrial intermembrane space import and assembly protein 40-like n=1 Tax=Homarus americanus TaxID=6706 RepID=A0A8J5NC04_HOMAM|nr:mitochondrial intermembrane space import and assembly protein 40-like [Homarus americanus]KAG7177530.1 Mitochondrial intermembrane space import and assembly protein 40-like [Homarus americanus]
MSYCKQEGKDRVVFVTEEDHKGPAAVSLPDDDEPPAGLIQPDGEINWACPCLGGMATGPCGVEFREAFSCFHYSTQDPKGSECLEPFRQMSECMAQYPNVYGNKEEKEDMAKVEIPSEASPEVGQSEEVSAKA